MLQKDALKDKVIIITGGGTGIGKAIAAVCSSLGAGVVIASRRIELLQQAAAELKHQYGNEVLAVQCDVRDEQGVAQMFESVVQHFGQFDAVVNNAAGNFIMPTERLTAKAFSTVIDIVLKGTIHCCLKAGQYWIAKSRPGTLLNMLTTYAATGSGYVVPSAAAKGGVLALTRSLAVEWGPYGIRCNAIAPGPVATEGAWRQLFPEQVQPYVGKLEDNIPLRRLGTPEEIAHLAAYLLSDFSAYVNGSVVVIDGGEWLQGAGQFNRFRKVPPSVWDELQKERARK